MDWAVTTATGTDASTCGRAMREPVTMIAGASSGAVEGAGVASCAAAGAEMAMAPTARPVTEITCRQLAPRKADFLNDFTFQSLFPEAAAGTATIPSQFPPGWLELLARRTHESPAGKDAEHWRKNRRPVKRL